MRTGIRTILIASLLACVAHGQMNPDLSEAQRRRVVQLVEEFGLAFSEREYERGEALLAEVIELDGINFVHHYNRACVLSHLGRVDEACASLQASIERGFADVYQLTRDPDLEGIRDEECYTRLVANWKEILGAGIDTRVEALKRRYGRNYSWESDPALRVVFATWLDEQSLELIRQEVNRVVEWSSTNVFGDLMDERRASLDVWVVVLLPNRIDFRKWAVSKYGPSAINTFHSIGGSYDHDRKLLVAQDLGQTLRHEFMHVLHWRSNTRQGQIHPVWIQEGLCSLVEDYDMVGGRFVPMPSWRTNIARRLAGVGKLMRLEDLANMPRSRFTGSRPLANYAQARTVFLYLERRGKLREWYDHYTRNYDEDRTGLASMQAVTGLSLNDLNADYAHWVATLPEIAEEIRAGMASLGIEIDQGQGDGPRVVAVRSRAVRRAGIKTGDVITMLDGRSTRDLNEFVRVLASMRPGQTVEVSLRRVRRHLTVEVQLTAAR